MGTSPGLGGGRFAGATEGPSRGGYPGGARRYPLTEHLAALPLREIDRIDLKS